MTQTITDEEIDNFWDRFNPISFDKFKEIVLQINILVSSRKDAEIKELREEQLIDEGELIQIFKSQLENSIPKNTRLRG